MRAAVLDEPELEFGGACRHVDPRFGILNYGPADLSTSESPGALRIGMVGPGDQLPGLRAWLEGCREGIGQKDEQYPHLFPPFPGCDIDVGLHTTLVFSDRNSRVVSEKDLRAIGKASRGEALTAAVDLYTQEITALADEHRVDVLLVARPQQLADTVHRTRHGQRSVEPAIAKDGGVEKPALPAFANFHDLLKSRLLTLRQPIQIIRRSTWDEATPPPRGRSREDEATRAWNLHVALYYKAGGVPWRLRRESTDLASCYVGVAFYRNSDKDTLDTSVAQVFNERGDGVIVRGGPARVSGDDRQPHLDRDDAFALLASALETYRLEHKTQPARVVLHKTSSFTEAEIEGFEGAAEDRHLDSLELSWITDSEDARLFRPGAAPPLRGTLMVLSPHELALYTKGSVEFYSTYPGMYVPQPIGIRPVNVMRSPEELAMETLALTKMNWNQTRLDGRLPVTLRTAHQVKRVLRFCAPDQKIATRYAHYM
jgi:hypothetical protein